MRPAYIFVGS